MRVLITDADERSALAAARSLARAGHEVHAAGARAWSLAGTSRSARAWRVSLDPLADGAGFAAAVGDLARRLRAHVVLPVTDASVEALLTHRAALPTGVILPFPDLGTYRAASDKARVARLAAQCGFAIPETRVIRVQGEWEDALPPPDFFPAAVKPHRSVAGSNGTRVKTGVALVADRDACRRALAALPPEAFPVLVQRRVWGAGEGLFALRWAGRPVALFAHRRLREKPPSGGVSVYRESIALDDGLTAPGLRLLDALDWRGVAMIECKRERDTGRPYLMEVNGRFWGSLQLAIDAGVDFPALLVRCAAGETVAPRPGYRVGVRSRWFWGDVDQLLLRLRRSRAALGLEAGAPSRAGALREFLRVRPGRDRWEVWRWTDPAPFVLETLRWFAGLIRRTAGATRKSRAAPTGSLRGSGAP